jgi:putative ABC transport system permease protein
MKNKYILKISFKNLFSNRLRTFLTLGGVVIGVGSIVFLVSLGFGLQRLVTSEVATMEEMKTININPGGSEILRLNGEVEEKLTSIDSVVESGKVINVAGRARYQSSVIDAVAYGVDDRYLGFENFRVSEGRMFSSQDAREVVVNRSALNLLGIEENQESMIDQTVKFDFIITTELLDGDSKVVISEEELKIVGIEDSTKTPTVYLPLQFLEENKVSYYSGIKLKVDDPENVTEIRDTIENMGYKTEYVGDTVSQIDQVFDIFKVVLAGFGGIAMVVAALGMFNTLTVSLLERIREVGLLKALGMSRADIRKLFLTEALLIGIGGGLMGLVLGLLVGNILNYSINALAEASGAMSVNFFYMPWTFALGMALFSVFIGIITGIYPAQRAVKINALDALRYE